MATKNREILGRVRMVFTADVNFVTIMVTIPNYVSGTALSEL
jgi:hypothetical protein